jgi:S1-C subfamily serine protease
VYPLLRRLERAGWIIGRWETEEEKRRQQRPSIRFYVLSDDGLLVAHEVLDRRPTLGMKVESIDTSLRGDGLEMLGVAWVEPGGPAAKAGIQAGSLIISVAGKTVRSQMMLRAVLATLRAGRPIPVMLWDWNPEDGNEQIVVEAVPR